MSAVRQLPVIPRHEALYSFNVPAETLLHTAVELLMKTRGQMVTAHMLTQQFERITECPTSEKQSRSSPSSG